MEKITKKVVSFLSFENKLYFYCAVIFCLLLAGNYRLRYYWQYPPVYDSFDELATVWLGQSLAKSGIPTSWSYHNYYSQGIPQDAFLKINNLRLEVNGKAPSLKNYSIFPKPLLLTKEVDINGYKSHFNLVSPYLEQPPLAGLIISLPSIISGKNSFDSNIKEIRLPFIYYGIVSVFLVIVLSNILFGRQIALISGLMYATIPTVVVGSRLALPENLLVLFLLMEIIVLELYKRKKKAVYLYLAYLISLISPLLKIFGLSAVFIGTIYSWIILKNRKRAIIFVLLGIMSLLTYCIYGILLDKSTFMAGIIYQSNRFFSGPNSFLIKILVPKITKIFLDGWVIFAWISLFVLVFREKISKYYSILIPLFSYLLIFIFFGGEDYGWYRLPLYPFLIISGSVLIFEIISKAKLLPSMIFIFTALASSFYWGLRITNWTPYLLYFRLILIFMLFVLLCKNFTNKKQIILLSSLFMLILFMVAIYLNTRTINFLNSIWPNLGDKSSLIIGK